MNKKPAPYKKRRDDVRRNSKKKEEGIKRKINKEKSPKIKKKKKEFPKETSKMDIRILYIVILLVLIGNVAVFTSSYVYAQFRYLDSLYFLKRTMIFSSLGFFIMMISSFIPYRYIKKHENKFYVVVVVLLILTKFSPLGIERNFARRWISIGPLGTLMPSELAKFAVIFMTASVIENFKDKNWMDCLIRIGVIMSIPFLLVVIQPDMSTSMTIAFTSFAMFMVAGGPYLYLFLLSSLGGFAVILLIAAKPYRVNRFMTFLNPFADKLGSGFQVVQSLYAISSGGITGLGLGQSRQKFFYLPEPQNDFIFAIICEEFGLIGAGALVLIFTLLIIFCMDVSSRVNDIYGSMVVCGITAQIGVQVLMNIGVATSSIPNTGIALPFISYGGTSLVIMMWSIGIILNISKYRDKKI